MDKIERIIEAALWSSHLTHTDGRYVSLLIVAPIEAGKSECILQYKECQYTYNATDLTARGISKDLSDPLLKREIRHLLIPEFLIPLSKNKDTTHSLEAFFNSMIEDGVQHIHTYHFKLNLKNPVRAAIIGGITQGPFQDRYQKRWFETGLLTRFLPVTYRPSALTLALIRKQVESNGTGAVPKALRFHEGPVTLTEDIASLLDKQVQQVTHSIQKAMGLSSDYDRNRYPIGTRTRKNLMRLIKGLALSRGKSVVDAQDYADLQEMANYINLDYNEL